MLKYISRTGYDWSKRRQTQAQTQQYQRQTQTAWERQQPRDTSQWHIPSVQYDKREPMPTQSPAQTSGRHPRVRMRIHMR